MMKWWFFFFCSLPDGFTVDVWNGSYENVSFFFFSANFIVLIARRVRCEFRCFETVHVAQNNNHVNADYEFAFRKKNRIFFCWWNFMCYFIKWNCIDLCCITTNIVFELIGSFWRTFNAKINSFIIAFFRVHFCTALRKR